jgi:hypothetical protein
VPRCRGAMARVRNRNRHPNHPGQQGPLFGSYNVVRDSRQEECRPRHPLLSARDATPFSSDRIIQRLPWRHRDRQRRPRSLLPTFTNSVLSGSVLIDTTQVATDTIDYVATDTWGNTSTSTRTVIIEAAATLPSIESTPATSTTAASSSAQ